jgi:Fic family protein
VSYKPVYTITPLLLSEVEQVAALRERILAAAVQVPWIPALQKDTRIRNAHSSTAIEGNPLTLEQVRAVEEGREIPATAQRPRREVANYFAGLRFVEKNAQRSAITDAEVLKLHRIMAGEVMDQGTAGQYRTIRVRVGSYVAPRPKQEQLLHLLREHKALAPREIWEAVGVSKQGALDLLRPLIKAGLVKRVGTKKAGRYVLT